MGRRERGNLRRQRPDQPHCKESQRAGGRRKEVENDQVATISTVKIDTRSAFIRDNGIPIDCGTMSGKRSNLARFNDAWCVYN